MTTKDIQQHYRIANDRTVGRKNQRRGCNAKGSENAGNHIGCGASLNSGHGSEPGKSSPKHIKVKRTFKKQIKEPKQRNNEGEPT